MGDEAEYLEGYYADAFCFDEVYPRHLECDRCGEPLDYEGAQGSRLGKRLLCRSCYEVCSPMKTQRAQRMSGKNSLYERIRNNINNSARK